MGYHFRLWHLLIIMILGVGIYYFSTSSLTLAPQCQGYCNGIHPEYLQNTKAVCEANIGVSDGCFNGECFADVNSYGVRCVINAGCIDCKECEMSHCVEAGPCTPSNTKQLTCYNQCDGLVTTKTVSCTYVPPDPDPDPNDECSSDGECDDSDASTTDQCVRTGNILTGYHYECKHTEIPYYDDRIQCMARSYFGIDDSYEWRENTVKQCAIPIVNLICHEESAPYCALKPDVLLASIVVGILGTIGIAFIGIKVLRGR